MLYNCKFHNSSKRFVLEWLTLHSVTSNSQIKDSQSQVYIEHMKISINFINKKSKKLKFTKCSIWLTSALLCTPWFNLKISIGFINNKKI